MDKRYINLTIIIIIFHPPQKNLIMQLDYSLTVNITGRLQISDPAYLKENQTMYWHSLKNSSLCHSTSANSAILYFNLPFPNLCTNNLG
jgi:hypothetical protein